MPKLTLLLLFMAFILPTSALAKVEVNISNNLDGSNNSVKVNSKASTNYQSSNSGTSGTTHITIDNNGEKKEYHGSGGNVKIKSSDGKSTVSVSNNSVTTDTNITSNTTVNSKTNITVNSNTSDSSPSAKPEATVAGIFKDSSQDLETKSGLWAFIKREISELFKLFS